MTVIKERNVYCEYPDSGNSTELELIELDHISDDEIYDYGNVQQFTSAPVRIIEKRNSSRMRYGKRKLRRLQRELSLVMLNIEDEPENPVQLMEYHKSPFEKLMENENALKSWYDADIDIDNLPMKQPKKCTCKISAKLKRAMKRRKNLPTDMLCKHENDLLQYFTKNPAGIYTSQPQNSFERLSLHAIAQYHNLDSRNVSNKVNKVEVCCSKNFWLPEVEPFCECIKKFRH